LIIEYNNEIERVIINEIADEGLGDGIHLYRETLSKNKVALCAFRTETYDEIDHEKLIEEIRRKIEKAEIKEYEI